jgi:hypothetical protein
VTAGHVGTLVRRGRLEARRVGVWLAVSEASVARFAEQRRAVEEDAASGEIRRLMGVRARTPICAPEETERRRQHNLRPERLAQLRALAPWKETTGTLLKNPAKQLIAVPDPNRLRMGDGAAACPPSAG